MLHEALRAERDLTARYLDLAQVLIVVVRTDHTIQYANRRATQILGWSHDEIVGRDWFELAIPARFRDERRRDFDAIVAGGPIPERSPGAVVSRPGNAGLATWP